MNDQAPISTRINSLQILRALAAWLVVYHHYMQLFWRGESSSKLGWFLWNRGAFGVDVFFVLSGVVMCLAVQSRRPTLARFLSGRVMRIVPAYWFFTLVLLLADQILPRGFTFTAWTPESLVLSLALVPHQNPSGIGPFPYLTVGWTLSFEMFFYLLLGLCLVASNRRAVLLCIGLLIVIRYLWPPGLAFSELARSPHLREFAAGLVLGLLWTSYSKAAPRRLLAFGGTGALVAGALLLANGYSWRHRLLAATAVVCGSMMLNFLASESLRWVRIGKWLGDMSYSTYLAHPVVLGVSLAAFGERPEPLLALSALLSSTVVILGTSYLGFRYVEGGQLFVAGWRALCGSPRTQ